jgi:hypothetical protein
MARIPAVVLQHFIGLSDYERKLAIDKASRELGMTVEQIENEIESFQSGGFNQDKSVAETPIQEISRTQQPLLRKQLQNSPKNKESRIQSSNTSASLFFLFVIILLLYNIFDPTGRQLTDPQWFWFDSWYTLAISDCDSHLPIDQGTLEVIERACRNGSATARGVVLFSGLGVAASLAAIFFLSNQKSNSESSLPKRGGPKFVDDSHKYRFKYDPSHSGQVRQTRATQAIACPHCKAALGIPEKRPIRVTCPACMMDSTFED